MRILCLHGVGSSGAILERQMASLQRELDPSYELVFVDGPFECERGPGVPEFQEGPFFSHTEGYSPLHIAEAVGYLQDHLEYDGPFDGIFGFSQGAALTLSYFHQQEMAGASPNVRFACLFSTAMPLSADEDVGGEIISKLQSIKYDMRHQAADDSGNLSDEEQEFVDIMRETIVDAASQDPNFPWADMDVYRHGKPETIPRVMFPAALQQKIQVPTVHVWGLNDYEYMIKMAELARSLCDDSRSKTVLHGGLHDIPKRPTEIQAVLRNLDWAISQV